MPAVDYNYDYYEYQNGRKMNKAANTRGATNKGDSFGSSSAKTNKKSTSNTGLKTNTRTRQSTKEQVRMATYEAPKKKATRKKHDDLEIPTIRPNQKRVADTKKQAANRTTNKKTITKSTTNHSKKQNIKKPVEMKLKKPELSQAQKKKAMEKAMNKVKNVVYLVTGFGIAFFICYRYSLINEKFNELEKTKKELATAQTINEQIQADIDSQTDLSYIENYAKYQLGMQKPSNSQIVYVNVEKEDRILTPVTIEEDSSKTWFEQLYDEIAKLFE